MPGVFLFFFWNTVLQLLYWRTFNGQKTCYLLHTRQMRREKEVNLTSTTNKNQEYDCKQPTWWRLHSPWQTLHGEPLLLFCCAASLCIYHSSAIDWHHQASTFAPCSSLHPRPHLHRTQNIIGDSVALRLGHQTCDQAVVGSTPSRAAIKLPRSTQPSIPPG